MSRKQRYIPMDKRISNIAKTLDIQGNEPSTEYDPYMIGLYNGIEMALAELERREAIFKKVPRKRKNIISAFVDKWITKKYKPIGSDAV